jgi:glutarate dioxygenase
MLDQMKHNLLEGGVPKERAMTSTLTLEREETAADERFRLLAHPHHPRLRQIELDAEVVAKFCRRTQAIDVQNLEYVPFMRFMLAEILTDCAGADFAALVRSLVRNRETGGFTTGMAGVTADADDFVRFGTAVGHLLGPCNHDAMSGTYYARFHVRDTDESDSYLRQAYRLFTLHTDGTFVSDATDWLLMMKFQELNALGGESRFLHLDDWAECMRFEQHPLGRRPLHYKAPGSKNVTENIERPVFFDSEFGLATSFIDQFVQPANREEAIYLHDL